MVQQFGMLGDMADTEYGRYQDDLAQYWQNLSFSKEQADDAYNRGFAEWQTNYENQYQADRDQVADQQWQAQFDEAKRQYDEQYAFAQRQYNDSKSSSGSSGGSSGGGGYNGGNNTVTNTGATDTVSATIKEKAASFTTNEDLANYLDGLTASGSITDAQADALYAENKQADVVALSKRSWKLVDGGGINWFGGIDNNAVVKDQYGNTYKLSKLVDALVAEGMDKSAAKDYVKKLQASLGA